MSRRSFPRLSRPKLAALCCALILAGCGTQGSTKWQQVQGDGFRFNAPVGWTVTGSTAKSGSVSWVGVRVFPLLHPYEQGRQAAVARELDRVAAMLARQSH